MYTQQLFTDISTHTHMLYILFDFQQFNLTDMLNANTSTILAPTNDAFSELSEEEFNSLVYIININPENFTTLFI